MQLARPASRAGHVSLSAAAALDAELAPAAALQLASSSSSGLGELELEEFIDVNSERAGGRDMSTEFQPKFKAGAAVANCSCGVAQ